MKSRLPIALAALLLAAVPAFAQTKIAIANPIKILNELAETKDINKAMEGEQAGFKAQVGEREQKLKELQAQRDQLKPDAPQWADLNKQLVQQRAEAQAWAQTSQQELGRKFRDQAKRMNEKITATVKEVAKAKQIDLVLADQKPEVSDQQMDSMNPQQVMGLLFGKNVLYGSEAIDLTQETIARLDATYKAK
ncbi:MAG TPA: OmpH family outer membrane protein [Tepidisphaeraceae bacterium]|jgi:Skp family chaperone for outer membrane proteins